MKRAIALVVAAVVLWWVWLMPASATAPGEDGEHKVTICHRTASDTNPYVFIEVDEASLSPGHLDNADPGHKPTFWKSDGTWRGVPHVEGDPKDDYLAQSEADCEDITVSPSPTPEPTPSPTPEPTPSPTPEPPVDEPPVDEPPVDKPDRPDKPVKHGRLPVTGPVEDAILLGAVALALALMGSWAIWRTRRDRDAV